MDETKKVNNKTKKYAPTRTKLICGLGVIRKSFTMMMPLKHSNGKIKYAGRENNTWIVFVRTKNVIFP